MTQTRDEKLAAARSVPAPQASQSGMDKLYGLMAESKVIAPPSFQGYGSITSPAGNRATAYSRPVHKNALRGAGKTKKVVTPKHHKKLHSVGQGYSVHVPVGKSTTYTDERTGDVYHGPEYERTDKRTHGATWRKAGDEQTFEIERKVSSNHEIADIYSESRGKLNSRHTRNTKVSKMGG